MVFPRTQQEGLQGLMLPLLIVGAVVVIAAVLYLTLTHPDGLTGPSYHRAKKSILGALVLRGRPWVLNPTAWLRWMRRKWTR